MPPELLIQPVDLTTLRRVQIIMRAQSWVNEGVPYSQTSWWRDANGDYRQDCSGYVSMAWGLDTAVDYWTKNLPTVSHPIDPGALLPGDALLRNTTVAASHIVLFAGWADAAKTHFNLYEEAHTGTDARYVADASLAQYLAEGFVPYRYDGLGTTTQPNLGAPGPVTGLPTLPALPPASAPPAEPQQPGLPAPFAWPPLPGPGLSAPAAPQGDLLVQAQEPAQPTAAQTNWSTLRLLQDALLALVAFVCLLWGLRGCAERAGRRGR